MLTTHARMLILCLPLQAGYDVLGGYMSPVNDGYGKPGLLPAAHRLRMCELAADAAPAVMVDRCAFHNIHAPLCAYTPCDNSPCITVSATCCSFWRHAT